MFYVISEMAGCERILESSEKKFIAVIIQWKNLANPIGMYPSISLYCIWLLHISHFAVCFKENVCAFSVYIISTDPTSFFREFGAFEFTCVAFKCCVLRLNLIFNIKNAKESLTSVFSKKIHLFTKLIQTRFFVTCSFVCTCIKPVDASDGVCQSTNRSSCLIPERFEVLYF